MRMARAVLGNRRMWAGLALGCALAAAGVLVWNRGSHEGEANARGSEPVSSKPMSASPGRLEAPMAAAESASAPEPGFGRYADYFNRNYYATYSYVSPAYAPADWGGAPAATPPAPPAPQSVFTLPSIADLLEPAQLLSKVPLAAPVTAALPDVSRLAPAVTLSVPAPASPGLLTNNTPFHLFVTSDPVTAASSTASGAPSIASSGSAAGGAMGTATGAVGSVTSTAGSLLRK
jgi:hypothetical protein